MPVRRWRSMIRGFTAQQWAVPALLRIVPKRWRSGAQVLAGFASEADPRGAMIRFVRGLWDKLTQPAQDIFATLRKTVDFNEILEGVVFSGTAAQIQDAARRMMQRVASWNQTATKEFLQLRRIIENATGNPADALTYLRWLLREQFGNASPRLRFEELRRNHPTFQGGSPTHPELDAFQRGVDDLRRWDTPNEAIRLADGSLGTIGNSDRFGRRVETITREFFEDANRMVDNADLGPAVFPAGRPGNLDAANLSTKVTQDGWHFPGQQFTNSRNFPGADLLFKSDAGDILVGQVSHGTGGHLVGKFRELLNLGSSSYNSAFFKMVEHLQFMEVLTPPPRVATATMPARGTEGALDAGARELLPKLRLFVPEKEVAGLRALLASHLDFRLWQQDTGLTGQQLLDLVQPIKID